MPVESSIYWNSFDSQRTSGGSSNNSDRHYVDPWDLENYAYLRRHSIHVPSLRYEEDRRTYCQPEYWYSQTLREAQYSVPGCAQKLYCDSSCRKENNAYHYHQPIYEDRVPNCAASYSVYTPLSSAPASWETMENCSLSNYDYRSSLHSDSQPGYTRNYFHQSIPNDYVRDLEKLEYNLPEECYTRMSPVDETYMTDVIAPLHLDLNTYGHLKIDYTDSWNSLKRKISK